MTDYKLSMALAKVMIAAAWSDGELQPEERDCMKEFIMRLPNVSENDWENLDVYMSMPIEEEERLELMDDLRNTVKNDIDKQFVMNALELVFMADGIVSPSEAKAIGQIRNALGLMENEEKS